MLGEAYVGRCYGKFRSRYFAQGNLPDFSELDFEFKAAPGEWGSITWDEHGEPALILHPVTRQYSAALKETLLHEMVHLAIGPKLGHGREFWREAKRIHDLGAFREYFG